MNKHLHIKEIVFTYEKMGKAIKKFGDLKSSFSNSLSFPEIIRKIRLVDSLWSILTLHNFNKK